MGRGWDGAFFAWSPTSCGTCTHTCPRSDTTPPSSPRQPQGTPSGEQGRAAPGTAVRALRCSASFSGAGSGSGFVPRIVRQGQRDLGHAFASQVMSARADMTGQSTANTALAQAFSVLVWDEMSRKVHRSFSSSSVVSWGGRRNHNAAWRGGGNVHPPPPRHLNGAAHVNAPPLPEERLGFGALLHRPSRLSSSAVGPRGKTIPNGPMPQVQAGLRRGGPCTAARPTTGLYGPV